jgi:DNA recombination protein RmuC
MIVFIAITAAAITAAAILALLLWLIITHSAGRRDLAGQSGAIALLQQQLESLRTAQDGLRNNLQESLQKGQQSVSQHLQAQQDTLSRLNTQIGALHSANQQMLPEVRRLHDILASPQMRGQLGEWSLENLLSTILPQASYKLQHQFKDGKIVDALIQMPQYSVPVDAKFPLPSFEAMLRAESDDAKVKLRRQFQKDVANHIDKIAANYIRPAEGTLDFALMYIPAENVYYETIARHDTDSQDIMGYALDKKVIPVSPSLLYAYLMTIVMGLHGLQIEKQAEEILQGLKTLNASFADFGNTWDTLGKHLRNAQSQYEEGSSKFTKIGMRLSQIQVGEEETKSD